MHDVCITVCIKYFLAFYMDTYRIWSGNKEEFNPSTSTLSLGDSG
jgi:hypothetical protein